jgi:hypothetical protein
MSVSSFSSTPAVPSISTISGPKAEEVQSSTSQSVALKRHLGLFSGVCFVVGMIIGSILALSVDTGGIALLLQVRAFSFHPKVSCDKPVLSDFV